jgi:DNA mismatch repair protein MLH3
VTSSFSAFLVVILFSIQDRDDDDENDITWTDPNTNVTFLIDKRTGHSYPRASLRRGVDEEDTGTVNSARRTIASADSGDKEGQAPQWILDALKVGTRCAETASQNSLMSRKDNPAYFVKEQPIPVVSQRFPNVLPSEHIAPVASATYPSGSLSFTFDETSTWCLQRDDLTRMKVINQLDRKFIVCAVDAISESVNSSQASDIPKRMLVLVDQHAASERVRVEGFLKTLCHHFLYPESNGSQSAFLVELNPPRPILLSRREASILCRGTKSILGRWGFGLSWPRSESRDQDTDQDAYEQVLVHSIPQVVGEKVRQMRFVTKRCSSVH